jgi:glycosyltransferase involved in cell wall biosynthesis
MDVAKHKMRLAVVSPFLDKSHGTERMVVEWLSRVDEEFEIHIYSQRVEDLDDSKFVWHRIPELRGPHLLNFLWWFAANHLWRAFGRRFRGLTHDLTFSPGPNCLDADAISVHIVFAEFLERVKSELQFKKTPIRSWPRLLHRKLYYRLVIFLERQAYTNPRTRLILTARQSERDIKRFYGGEDRYPLVSTGLDHRVFNPARCRTLREEARLGLGLQDDFFVALLIGNDLRKKGIRSVLGALTELRDLPIHLVVVSREDSGPFRAMIADEEVTRRVHFLPPRNDVESYYAAADVYLGPSLEDTFALPVLEAMACGLPVIVSARAGASELVTEGVDGMVLHDPTDKSMLATMIRHLFDDADILRLLGRNAAITAQQYTWERSSAELAAVFREILAQKGGSVLPHTFSKL